MDNEKLEELWDLVKTVGHVERLDYEAMVTLGSVFGQMKSEILKLQKENKSLEKRVEMYCDI